MKEKIERIIIESLVELNEELGSEDLKSPNEETRLFGGNGGLDSISLVSLITDIEDSISEEFGVDIVLADERAMSQRTSPFRRISSLSKYIEKLLSE